MTNFILTTETAFRVPVIKATTNKSSIPRGKPASFIEYGNPKSRKGEIQEDFFQIFICENQNKEKLRF